jgi:hypothetical protein
VERLTLRTSACKQGAVVVVGDEHCGKRGKTKTEESDATSINLRKKGMVIHR